MDKRADQWLVYLDWNVIIDLSDGDDPAFLSWLIEAKRIGILILPFSSTHVEEMDNLAENSGQADPLVMRRLNFLSCLCDNVYQYNSIDVDTPRYQIESPHSVLATVTEVKWARDSSRRSSSLLSLIPVDQFRRLHSLDAKKMNNLAPEEIIARIQDHIKSEHANLGNPDRPDSIDAMVEWALNLLG